MKELPIEIKSIILNLLDYKSQINFVFTSKSYQILIKYWKIKDKIFVNNELTKLSYYDCFENIKIDNIPNIFPKKLRYLTFGYFFNQSIKECIPSEARSVWLKTIDCNTFDFCLLQ